jgi:uncharacterized repeat protein (TIGR02543 family)
MKMLYKQGWYRKILAIILALAMFGAGPLSTMQAYATDGGGGGAPQTRSVSSAEELEAALGSFGDEDIIRLTADITYNKGIVLSDKSLTFDVGTYTLNVNNNGGTGLEVGAGAEVHLTGSGKFNVSGEPYGVKAEGLGAKAEVTGASGSGSSGIGAYAKDGGQVTVKGTVWGQNVGAYSFEGGSIIVMNGEVSGGVGAEASGEGSLLTITGNVKGTYTHGVKASHGGKITVNGEVTSESQDGIYANLGGEIEVHGNVEGKQNGAYVGGNAADKLGSIHVTGKVTGLEGSGVLVKNGGTAVIDGDVTGWKGPGAYCSHGDIVVNGNSMGTTAGVAAGIKNSTITVRGNVIANSSSAPGAEIANYGLVEFTGLVGGKIIIDGEIQSNKDYYIRINNVIKDGTPGSRDAESGLDGYYSYSAANLIPTELGGSDYATSVVFVKAASSDMVCEIGEDQYATLGEALIAVKDGETIKLLQNIIHTDPITWDKKQINFDLGNYDLLLDLSTNDSFDPALTVEGGGKIHLIGTGTGEFNVRKDSNTAILIRGANSGATIHNVELTNYGTAVNIIGDGGIITVKGSIKAEKGNGVNTNAKNVKVTVQGDITAGQYGINTAANPDVEVTVNGDITVIDPKPEDLEKLQLRGIWAYGGTSVTVGRNVIVRGADCVGVFAEGGTINVKGNVVSSGIGAKAKRNYPYGNGAVTIDGSLSAGNPFIVVGDTEKTAADKTEPTTKPGFLTYSDGVSNVWIGSVGDLEETIPGAPQNFTATPGDTQVTLNWTVPADNGGSAITEYEVSKDDGASWASVGLNTSYTFTGLTNGITYTFKVRAVNSKGPGAEVSIASAPEAVPVLTYTVNFYSNGSLYDSKTVNSGSALETNWPNNPTRSGYSFGGWFSGQNGTGTQYTNSTIITADVNLYAKWTYNSSSGGGGSSSTPATPALPIYKADVKAENGTDTVLPVKVDVGDGTASVEAEEQSLAQGGTVITIPSIPGVATYSAGIPVPVLATTDVKGTLTLDTDAGSITVLSNMLTGVANTDGNKAQITIGRGDKSNLPEDVKNIIGDRPLIQLTLSIDGRQIDWSNPDAPVTISIPYAPTEVELANQESIVIWYIDGSGNITTIPNGCYNPYMGTVTFRTTHFSEYAVAYNKVNLNDVPAGAWYAPAVSFIAAREITTGTGDGKYSPNTQLSRGEFIVLMMRAYGIAPDTSSADNFSDAGNTYYTGFLAAAKQLGITAGVGNNKFAPKKEITRQEMFTLLYNALKVIGQLPEDVSGKEISDFHDAGQVDPWAKDAISMLIRADVINGSNGKLSPLKTTTRAEIAQVLYNLLGE